MNIISTYFNYVRASTSTSTLNGQSILGHTAELDIIIWQNISRSVGLRLYDTYETKNTEK